MKAFIFLPSEFSWPSQEYSPSYLWCFRMDESVDNVFLVNIVFIFYNFIFQPLKNGINILFYGGVVFPKNTLNSSFLILID